MKKFAFITALLLCLSAFSACGDTDDGGSNKKSSSKSSPAYEANDDDDIEKTTDDEEVTTEEITTEEKTTEEITTEAATEAPTEAKEDISFVRGRIENNSYISEYANFRFDADSDWTYATEEQMLQLMGIATSQNGTKDQIDKLIADQAVIYDAHVIRNDGQKNVIFMFENVRKEGADPDALNAESFLQILQLNLNKSPGEEYGNSSEIKSFNIGSDEYKYFTTKNDSSAAGTLYQTYACKKVDDYYFGIIYTSAQDDFSSITGNFSTIK